MKKTNFKKALSLFMAVMMLLTCWVFIAPEKAEAAAGDYTVRVRVQNKNAADGGQAKLIVKYKPKNGTGTETSTEVDITSEMSSNEGSNITKDFTLSGFPTSVQLACIGTQGFTYDSVEGVLNGIFVGSSSSNLTQVWGVNSADSNTSGNYYSIKGSGGWGSVSWQYSTTAYMGDGLAGSKNWTEPAVYTVGTALSDASLTVPKGGSAVSKAYTVAFKDQYGVDWIAGGYTCSITPSTIGTDSAAGSLTYDGSQKVTVSFKEKAFSYINGYDSGTGEGTVTLKVTCGKGSTEATITLQSSKYYVYFQDAVDKHETWCYYNGSVTAPDKGCAKPADETAHYAFEKWNDNILSNITADKTVTSTYTSIAHTFTGDIQDNPDLTHSRMCTGTGADEPCTFYGLNGVTYGSVSCLDTPTWTGGDDSAHNGVCSECGNNLTHYPDTSNLWVEVVDEKYLASEPDCTNPAVYYMSCKTCGQASTKHTFTYGDEMGHSFVVIDHTDPTCTERGYDTYGCEVCHVESLNYNVYENDAGEDLYPAAHSWHYLTEDIGNGTHGKKCTVCGEWNPDTIEKHNYNQAGIVSRADCTNDQVYNFRCGGCGITTSSKYAFDSETREFTTEIITPALGHSWVKVVDDAHPEVAPRCNAAGSYWEQCSRCKIYEQRTVAADPDAHKWTAATPVENDQHSATCEYCGKTDITDCVDEDKNCVCDICGDAIAHKVVEVINEKYLVTPADCLNYAVYYKSCSVCGVALDDTFIDDSAYGAHSWVKTETDEFLKDAAACEKNAVYYYECSLCGASSKDVDGSTWESEGTALVHNYAAKDDNSNIVNNGDGTHSYYCQNGCGTTGGTTGCNYGAWDTTNANGHQKTCLDCGYTTVLEAHKWAEDGSEGWKPAEGNTGSAAGQMTRTCLICSRVETTACVYDKEVVVDATCLNDKYTEYTCTACGHGYTVIEANTRLDHSYTGEYDIDAENDQHRQLCVNGCKEYGEWVGCTLEYTQIAGTETHTATCPDCGNVDEGDCSGGKATCIQKAKCDKCGGDHGDYAPHDFTGTAVNVVDGTMNADGTYAVGTHWYNCSTDGCGEYGVGTEIGKTEECTGGTAYCTEQALCEACGNPHGPLDANNHKNTTAQPGKAPTCMEAGYTEYKTCDACGTELGKEVIPADPDAHKWSTTATSTNDGKHYYACEYNEDHKDVYDCVCTDPSILPPTCTEGGYTEHYCDECNYYWTTEPTEPIGHAWGEWQKDDKGGHYRICSNDVNHIDTGICAEDASSVVTAPTCTEQGYTTYTCNICGYVWVSDYTDPTGHHYTQKIIDTDHLFTDADYEATGVTTSACERADYYWFDCKDCDKNGKDETDTDKYPLNTRYYENGKGEGHDFTGKAYSEGVKDKLVLASPATCTDNEVYYTYCKVCHLSTKGTDVEATFTRWGTALDHSYENIVDEDNLAKNRVSVATCTEKAVYYKSCKNCGEVSENTFTYGEMTAHVYSEKIADYAHIITEANCETKATYWYDCKNCNSNAKLIEKDGMTEAEIEALQYSDGSLDSNNHVSLEKVPYKAPSCSEDGHSEYKKCAACKAEIGKVTKGYEKTGHSYTGEYRIANVVDADGNVTTYKHQRACKYGCGTYSDAAECGFSAWKQNADGKTHTMACVCGNSITKNCVANDNASCEDAATCKDCGGEMADTITGHDWGEWKSDENGKTHSRVCKTNSKHVETENCAGGVASGCGAIYCSVCSQQYATGVGHNWGTWVEISAATCEEPAVRKRACQACSATEEESYGEALGHDYDKDNDGKDDGVVTKEATCTEAGIITYTCLNNCGSTYTDVIKSLGHDLADEWTITVEPTCKDEGIQVKKCTHSWKDADGKEVKCDYYEEMTIPADKSKHVAGEWVADDSASNCETGLKSYKYCTVCGLKVDEKTEQISHDWVADSIVYGTCTANGYIKMVCAKCGSAKVFDENTPGFPNKMDDTVIDGETASKLLSKGGHKWETSTSSSNAYVIQDGYVVYVKEAATCSKTGKGYMICTAADCGAQSSVVAINKTAHNLKTMPASEATCQTPGHTSYLACRNCPYAEEPTKIPKLGHADTNANGKCDRCGFEMYEPDNGGTAACGCLCHDTSFFMAKIIYPIARFFWKIFGMNKTCSCGNKHY
ncbi:MAG: hypothetical protein IJW86_03375 [Clostridia bacterium]|nr:hypothetical protein [Clostridia bacterium]